MTTPKIISASRLAAKDLQGYIDKVVEALGHPGAFITDESLVRDMLSAGDSPHQFRRGHTGPWEDRPGNPEIAKENAEILRVASEKLGLPIQASDSIVTVAHKLKNLARS